MSRHRSSDCSLAAAPQCHISLCGPLLCYADRYLSLFSREFVKASISEILPTIGSSQPPHHHHQNV